MDPVTVLFIVFLVSGGILAAISIPLIQRRVPPNLWYGFRVRQTLAGSEVWYSVNEYSGRWLLGVGVAEMVAAGALPNLNVALYASLVGIVAVGGVLISTVQSVRYLHRVAERPHSIKAG